jgi:hypothetical protein
MLQLLLVLSPFFFKYSFHHFKAAAVRANLTSCRLEPLRISMMLFREFLSGLFMGFKEPFSFSLQLAATREEEKVLLACIVSAEIMASLPFRPRADSPATFPPRTYVNP